MPKPAQLDVSGLYGLPLAEFTQARSDLTRRARDEGDREQAAAIASLQKPSLAAWALNMLPRLREKELGELLRVGERAERAQARALAGGDSSGLHEAVSQLRRAAGKLTEEAAEILVKGGHAARVEMLLRVRRALELSAVTAVGREALSTGAFVEEPQPTGFDPLAPLAPVTAGSRPRAQRRAGQAEARQARRRALDEAKTALALRRRERVEAEKAARHAEREARARQREADKARRFADRAAELAARARQAEIDAEQRVADIDGDSGG